MMHLSEQLIVLIATAEDIMRRPVHQLPQRLPETFSELAAEIRRIDGLPSEGVRATRAGVIMCTAIEAFFAEANGLHHWQMLIGATLPLLKRDAFQAFTDEKEAAQETRR